PTCLLFREPEAGSLVCRQTLLRQRKRDQRPYQRHAEQVRLRSVQPPCRPPPRSRLIGPRAGRSTIRTCESFLLTPVDSTRRSSSPGCGRPMTPKWWLTPATSARKIGRAHV